MRKILHLFIVSLLLISTSASSSYAYWVWSPDIGKWVNPKKTAKDTPEEQLEWAMGFFTRQEWDRAIEEFEKIPANFPNSKLAAEGVYYVGMCWEAKQDVAKAADAYQRLIDKYPYTDRIKDAIKHEFDIANEFASGGKVKVLGIPALPGQEKAIEIYKHIVKNAPYGSYGDQAQFKIAEVYKDQGEYEEAQKAYQAVVDEYPNSELVAQAKYQIGYVAMQASKKAHFNEQYADRAIEGFQSFKNNFPADEKSVEADEAIKALRANKAATLMDTGDFYAKQKKFKSARVYYQEITDKYGDTPQALDAKKKVDSMVQRENEPDKQSVFGWPKIKLW